MSSRHTVALAVMATLLAVAPAAQAKLPAPKSKTVVFGKSIGGVKLGASLAAAKAAWGTGGTCKDQIGNPTLKQTKCTWFDSKNGVADFTVTNGKVTSVTLQASYDIKKQQSRLSGPITAFQTAKGIRIGSTFKALKKAYPKAQDGAADTFVILSGKITTSFGNARGKISLVAISTSLV